MSLLSRERKVTSYLRARRASKLHTGPGRMGHTGKGGGAWNYLRNPSYLRGTSDQVAGVNPWTAGAGAPMVGVPLGRMKGRRKTRGSVLCCDPLSWFERGKLIANPSAFILGLPGLGKSTLIRRWILGLDYQGVRSMVLGDLKGEHVALIVALGGQHIRVGRGRDFINVLDITAALIAAQRLRHAGLDAQADDLLADAKARREIALETLFTVHRGKRLPSRVSSILTAALRVLDARITDVPQPDGQVARQLILRDILDVIVEAPQELHEAAVSRGSIENYQRIVEELESDLTSLAAGDGLGAIFSQPSTVTIDPDRSVVFDVHSIGDQDARLRAAALMICWGIGFGQIAINNALADAKLEPQRRVLVVLDELWRALRAGEGLVDLVDGLIRLDRDKGVGVVMGSHSMDDLSAIQNLADRAKALGMVERSGMVVAFGLPQSEMPRLATAVSFSKAEQDILQSWTTPPRLSARTKRAKLSPGAGHLMVKVGKWKGMTAKLDLTPEELEFSNTDQRWDKAA
jgi:hypothetical protein